MIPFKLIVQVSTSSMYFDSPFLAGLLFRCCFQRRSTNALLCEDYDFQGLLITFPPKSYERSAQLQKILSPFGFYFFSNSHADFGHWCFYLGKLLHIIVLP